MENVRNRVKVELIKKDDMEKNFKQQSKLTFNGIHKPYTSYDSFTSKQNESLMDKPVFLGFAKLEVSKMLMWKTLYDKLQPHSGPENLHLHCMDCDSFALSIRSQNILNDLKNLQ